MVLPALLCTPAWANDTPPRVDFHTVQRDYSLLPGFSQVFVETSLLQGDRALAEQSSRKLSALLPVAFAALPPHAQRELRSLRVFLLWGDASPHGGLRSGMRYVRRGEPNARNGHDRRWEHAIVIYSAKNLMYLDDLWSKKALVHEMAHAWHVTHWPDHHAPIHQAWTNAVRSGLYTDVIDHKNRVIASAYALKNPLEYFAELSAARFCRHQLPPVRQRRSGAIRPNGVSHGRNAVDLPPTMNASHFPGDPMRTLKEHEIQAISGGATTTSTASTFLAGLLLGPLYPLYAIYNYFRINSVKS